MRILILSFYYEPDLSAGSFRTTALVESLKSKLSLEDHVEIITTMPNRYNSFSNIAEPSESIGNIRIDRIDTGSHKGGFLDQSILFFKFAYNVLKLIGKRQKYDIVYATSSRLMTAFLGAVIARYQGAKLFLDIRDIFTDTLESLFHNSPLKHIIPLLQIVERFTVRTASHINLVSKGFEDYFLSIRADVPYTFFSNGIDEIFLNYDFSKESPSSPIIITYAGNIGEGQGLEKILPGMAKALENGYQINVYGDGGRKAKLQTSLDGITNVSLYPPINRNELLRVYKQSDFLFLHLNDFEAFEKVLPSKIFEYGVTGKPIIAGVSGYARRFLLENLEDTVVFNPCDVDDFLRRFEKKNLEGPLDRREFIRNFSRSNIMNELSEKLYRV